MQNKKEVISLSIIIELDVLLARRKKTSKELAEYINITEANLSNLKNGKSKGIKWETLDKICYFLECEPGDIIKFTKDN